MFKKERISIVAVFAASLFIFVTAAVAAETKATVPARESIQPGFQQQLRTPYTISYAPQQFYIEYLFENPSGKGWWTGNTHVTISVSRQDSSPSCSKYDALMLVTDQSYNISLPQVCSFTSEFTNIPVFREERIRLACGQVLRASISNATTTWQEKIVIKARYWKSTGGQEWENVAMAPITANLRCEREVKPHK
jgi:hypothetical protein